MTPNSTHTRDYAETAGRADEVTMGKAGGKKESTARGESALWREVAKKPRTERGSLRFVRSKKGAG